VKSIVQIVLFALVFTVIGCESAYYSKSYAFSDSTWQYDEPKSFDFEISDTLHAYDMVLTINHRDIFPYQNLYLKTQTTFPSDTTIEQSLSLEIANAAGFWFGECSGSKCELSIPIQSNVHFKEIGKYRLQVEQYTRTDTLQGIDRIKLSLVEKTRP